MADASRSPWSAVTCLVRRAPVRTTSVGLDSNAAARRAARKNGGITSPTSRHAPSRQPDDTMLGGGNVKKLDEPPAHCRAATPMPFGCAEKSALSCTPGVVPNNGCKGSERMPQMAAQLETPRTRSTSKHAVWQSLEDHHETMRGLHLRNLFANDPTRGERMTADAAGVYLDYSKNRINDETLKLLIELAERSGLRARIDAMFRGEKINVTENRAVLHVALRAPKGVSIVVDGKNVVPQVHAVLGKMADFANRVRSGQWKGHSGKRIRNVANMGIGGADL